MTIQVKQQTVSREKVIVLAYESLDNFGRIFLPNAFKLPTPKFHHRIDRLLMDSSIKKKAIIAPRGHAKSTKASIVFPLRRTVFNPVGQDLLIAIISEAQAQSINFLGIIKWNLEHNQAIRAYFGDLVGEKWSEDEITTTNGVRIIARGTGQRIRGTVSGRESVVRPNLIILDDFESETNSATIEQIDKNKKWITRAVEPSLADDGELVAIGTIIHEAAYLSEIRDDKSFVRIFLQALMDKDQKRVGEVPIWPEKFSYKRLMSIKESLKARGQEDAFWQEYMNVPISPETCCFKKETFQNFNEEFGVVDEIQPVLRLYVDTKLSMVPLLITVGVDLAISDAPGANYTVIFVEGMDAEENRFILHYDRIREKDIENIVEMILSNCLEWKAGHVNIETVQFQQAVANLFYKRMMERNVVIGLTETKPRTSKDARIRSLQPHFSAGKVYHRAHMIELEQELTRYPSSATKDILDAFYLADTIAVPCQLPEFEGEFKSRKLPGEERVDWLVL